MVNSRQGKDNAGKRTHTSNDQYRVAHTARATEDLCTICQQHSTLIWDHVPPKGSWVFGKTKVSMRPSLNLAGDPKLRESQNGLKFRTLCRECNNLLGTKYDPEIMDFASLSRYRHTEIDDLVEIPIELDCGRDEDWPDVPSDDENNVVLVGNDGLKGIEARKKVIHQGQRKGELL